MVTIEIRNATSNLADRCSRMIIHLAAHAFPGRRPLSSLESANWVWRRLRAGFPGAIAACAMPDHGHILVAMRDAQRERIRLAHVLGALTRFREPNGQWSVAEPIEIRNAEHLLRHVRYVHLDPCRARLAH